MIRPRMDYYELEPKDNHFTDVLADVTHRCNMVCKNCYIPNRDIPDMNIDKMIETISQFPQRTMIRIIGAEPTMRDDLDIIVQRIRAAGHRCTLLTNGLKLASDVYTKRLKAVKLNHIYISLNGVDNDDWYEEIDELRCAKTKVRALENIHKNRIIMDTGTILVKGVNDEAPARLMNLLKTKNIKSVVCRFKNIGALGNYMKTKNFTEMDMIDLLSVQLKVSKDYILEWKNKPIYGNDDVEDSNFMFPLTPPSKRLRSGIWIKVADWGSIMNFDNPSSNQRRGRITPDWKIAPFFEHVKLNEGGY